VTEVAKEALDLDELKELSEQARTAHDNPHCSNIGVALYVPRLATSVTVLVAEVERLRAQRDEALRTAQESLASGWDGADDPEDALSDALRMIVRVLSRTEDGTDGAATCHHDDTFEGVCLRCKEHVGAEPEMEQWRIIQRLHVEDGTND
jgi:hypothetical protein